MKVKLINKSKNPDPRYAKAGDAGMDLRAAFSRQLNSGERRIIPTGIYLEIPEGYEAQIRPRSGMSINTGLNVYLGTIDSGYRGEIGVILSNPTSGSVSIEYGDRIAQMVFAKVENVEFDKAETLSESERGEGGYGHTGKV